MRYAKAASQSGIGTWTVDKLGNIENKGNNCEVMWKREGYKIRFLGKVIYYALPITRNLNSGLVKSQLVQLWNSRKPQINHFILQKKPESQKREREKERERETLSNEEIKS